MIEILKQLLDDIENLEYKSSDDYFWHGVNEAEMKIRHLIEDKIIELMKQEEQEEQENG